MTAPACKCSHTQSQHGTDRSKRSTCFGSVVCGCTTYRPKEKQP